MTEFDLNNPFNDASKDGMLPDGCGIFERYYTSGQEVDFCGLSPNPDDYETPQTLYEKILELVKRIIVAVDLNTNGTYKPSDFDIYPLIANATSVKDAVERLSKYIEDLQQKKFDKLNLKLKYENGNVSLVFNGEAYTTINIPEEQFLDSEETKFISAATIDDYMNDSSVIVGKPYLKLSFKTIDASGKPSITYTYIPMTYLFNVYGVEDTNSIDMDMVASGDTNVFSGNLRINDVSSNALKVDALGAYVEDLNPIIEAEQIRAEAAEKVNADAIVAETTRATNRENELDADIKNRIKSITGSNGINATTDINKNVTLSGKIKSGDKILSVDSNGFSSTLGMSISGKTISLTGIGNSEISKITVPGDDLTFAGSNGITVVKSGDTVTSTIIVDPNSSNQLTKSSTGLMVNPENITLVDSTGGTKILTTTANLVIVNVTSQLNYIGISNSKQDKITFFNNSALEVLFSFNNSSAGTNKFVKDYIITSLALPSKGSIDFVKRNDGWHISSLFGLSYFPDLGDSSRSDDYALIIKKDGTATIEEIVDMKAWDESILSDLSAVQLENMFPNAHAGFQLVCYSNNCIYEKANELGGWLKINCVKL